ncbi:hypothetical protein LINPERPRIM_LOCUS37719 [Linum perenne]
MGIRSLELGLELCPFRKESEVADSSIPAWAAASQLPVSSILGFGFASVSAVLPFDVHCSELLPGLSIDRHDPWEPLVLTSEFVLLVDSEQLVGSADAFSATSTTEQASPTEVVVSLHLTLPSSMNPLSV